jgi:hypothetical protein
MTHPIIKTENYLLVVDESEIKDDDWHLDNGVIKKWKGNLHSNRLTSKKIIFHLPLNNASTLEGVPLLPPLEDESNFFAEQETTKNEWNSEKSFKAGYNKAKEKYKYTEEDLRDVIEKVWLMAQEEESFFSAKEKIIKSLQQQKYPVAFECEMEQFYNKLGNEGFMFNSSSTIPPPRPKTITNSQGLTQLVGKYIY